MYLFKQALDVLFKLFASKSDYTEIKMQTEPELSTRH